MSESGNYIEGKERIFEYTSVAADVKSKRMLLMEVSDGHKHDGRVCCLNWQRAYQGKKTTKVLAHGAYERKCIFQFLAENETLQCIRVRRNSKVKAANQLLRNPFVIDQTNDLGRWKDGVIYGRTWLVETVISTTNGMFDEYIYSVKYGNIVIEIMLKSAVYSN